MGKTKQNKLKAFVEYTTKHTHTHTQTSISITFVNVGRIEGQVRKYQQFYFLYKNHKNVGQCSHRNYPI